MEKVITVVKYHRTATGAVLPLILIPFLISTLINIALTPDPASPQVHTDGPLPKIVQFLGFTLGCILGGVSCDYSGRRNTLVVSMLFEGVSLTLIIGVCSTEWTMAFTRFFAGLCCAYLVPAQVLLGEWLPHPCRRILLATSWVIFSLGVSLAGAMLLLFPQLIDATSILLVLLAILWLTSTLTVDESLRWLVATAQRERSLYYLNRLSYREGLELPSYEDIMVTGTPVQYNILHLFLLQRSRYSAVILIQLTGSGFYFLLQSLELGLLLCRVTGYAASEQQLVLIAAGLLSTLGIVLCSLFSALIGRRLTVGLFLVVDCAAVILQLLLHNNVIGLFHCAAMLALCGPPLIYAAVLWSIELFPTNLRGQGTGFVLAGMGIAGLCTCVPSSFATQVLEVSASLLLCLESVILPRSAVVLPETEEEMPKRERICGGQVCRDGTVEETDSLVVSRTCG